MKTLQEILEKLGDDHTLTGKECSELCHILRSDQLINAWRPVRKWKSGERVPSDYTYTTNYQAAREAADKDQRSHTNLGYTIDEVTCTVEAITINIKGLNYGKIIDEQIAKMEKSAKFDYLSSVLHLEPRYKVGKFNSCPNAGKCFATCLANSGRMRFDLNRAARLWKTKLFLEKQNEFFAFLIDDIEAVQRKAKREDLTPTIRLNGTSDIAWETIPVLDKANIFELFPEIQFIDYTKIEQRMLTKQPKNYHLTYSISERTPKGFVDKLYRDTKFNAAQVFANELPKYTSIGSTVYKVIDGDISDLRHLDKRKCIVGLTYKLAFVNKDGSAFRPTKDNGFITIGDKDGLSHN